jgi:dihydrofolate reductase
MENTDLEDRTGPFTRGPEGDTFKEDELRGAAASVFGRRTHDGFATVWPTVKSDMADRVNTLPKYLASRTIAKPEWNNTSLLRDDLVGSVTAVKASSDGDIHLRQRICLPFPDESRSNRRVRPMIYPVVLGRGIRLFPDGVKMDLTTTEKVPLGDGITVLRFMSRNSADA